MTLPRLTWEYTALRVQSLARSIRFYGRLGFEVGRRGVMEHGGMWVELRLPGSVHLLELNYYPPSNRYFEPFRPGAEFDHLGIRVTDIGGWVRQLRRWRLPILADFLEGRQRLVYVRDPDGNWVEFHGKVANPAARARGR